jgi:hypothetical protein
MTIEEAATKVARETTYSLQGSLDAIRLLTRSGVLTPDQAAGIVVHWDTCRYAAWNLLPDKGGDRSLRYFVDGVAEVLGEPKPPAAPVTERIFVCMSRMCPGHPDRGMACIP